jgi:hypothetical protein
LRYYIVSAVIDNQLSLPVKLSYENKLNYDLYKVNIFILL